jgi:hypothetical protein
MEDTQQQLSQFDLLTDYSNSSFLDLLYSNTSTNQNTTSNNQNILPNINSFLNTNSNLSSCNPISTISQKSPKKLKIYNCSFKNCNYKSEFPTNYKRHYKSQHTKKSNCTENDKCTICKKIFLDSQNLKRHQKNCNKKLQKNKLETKEKLKQLLKCYHMKTKYYKKKEIEIKNKLQNL